MSGSEEQARSRLGGLTRSNRLLLPDRLAVLITGRLLTAAAGSVDGMSDFGRTYSAADKVSKCFEVGC